MKVYTLTTQYANNVGALLQCYALVKYLRENEHVSCEVLDYQPVGANRSWAYFNKPRSFRDFVKNVYCIINLKLFLAKRKKNKVMRNFINTYIPLSSERFDRSKIETYPIEADAFICGSDQIWNFKYRFDLTYFFDFVDKEKSRIIAYAPSIADPWSEEKAQFITPYLKRFDALSIREVENLEQVKSLSPENSPVIVSDPVFLPSRNQWDSVADYKFCPDEPYIFCYFLSVSALAVKALKKIREITGLKVLHFNLNALDKFNSDYDIRVGGPMDFIGLISKAQYICTNSFHCSAFSIIYRKNFVFIPKSMANERISNLMKNFGLSDVFVSEEKLHTWEKNDLVVNYEQVDEKGDDFVKFSKDYLHNALFSNR